MPDSSSQLSQSSQEMCSSSVFPKLSICMQFSSSLRFRFSKASNTPKNINELQYWSEEARKKTACFTNLLETTEETNEVFIHQNILSYNKPSAQHMLASPVFKPSQEVLVMSHCKLLSIAPLLCASALY